MSPEEPLDLVEADGTAVPVPEETQLLADTIMQPISSRSYDVPGEGPELALIRGDAHYAIGEVMAGGGMGEILEARDIELDRPVVLKRLRSELATDLGAIRRLLDEAQVTGQLVHPGIVAVHEVGRLADGQPFFSMTRVEGRTLADVITALRERDPETLKRFGLLRRLQIMLRVCEAIAFAHSHGILHRDIKPDNLMIGPFGEVVVMDWGLAKRRGVRDDAIQTRKLVKSRRLIDDSAIDRTTDGEILGTPLYMSPEQSTGRVEKIDERSDIYSLGATFFELLLLRSAYERGPFNELMLRIAAGHYSPAGTVAGDPQIPSEITAVLAKAMSTRPDRRYQDVRELAADVEAYLEGRLLRAVRYSMGQRLVRWVRRHRAACVVVAMLGAAVLVAEHSRRYIEAADRRVADVQQDMQQQSRELAVRRHSGAGALHLQAGQYPRAVAAYSKAIELQADAASLWQSRALAKRRQGDVVGALVDYDKALELDPDFAEAYKQRATAYLLTGNTGRALADYDRAIAAAPEQLSAYRFRADARLISGDPAGALKDAQKAVEDPRYWQARCSLAVALAVRGRAAEARAELARAQEIAGDSSRLIGEAGRRVEGLIAMPLLAESLRDSRPAVRRYAARALGDLGVLIRGRLAVIALRRAIEDPEPAVRADVAIALGQIGPASSALLSTLRTLLANNDTAAAAIRALLKLGPAAIPELLAILRRGELAVYHPRVRTGLRRLRPQTLDAELRARVDSALEKH